MTEIAVNHSAPILREVILLAGGMNPVAADIIARVVVENRLATKPPAQIWAEAFEVGVDGSKPASALAVSARVDLNFAATEICTANLPLRIGTPFLWTHESQPRYAVVVAVEQGRGVEHGEIQFGFDAVGKIVVTKEFREIFPTRPALNPKRPSLFVVGDSTAFSNGTNQRGWGDELGNFFDSEKINVLNRARPGRSTRSFRNEGLWSRVLAEMKAGDFALIQFGHNDADKLAEGRCRGVLPGIGEEIHEVAMPDGSREIVHTFGWYLRQFIAETKAKGATPILFSPTAKNLWRDGKPVRRQSDYGDWSAAVAAACGVPFVDLTAIIAGRYDALGFKKVQALFCNANDNVHTSLAGARLNAECAAAELKKTCGFKL